MKCKSCILVVLLSVGLWCLPALLDGLSVEIPPPMRPFSEVEIVVSAPESGALTIRDSDDYGEQLPIAEALSVSKGPCVLSYDATSYGGMPLKQGSYQVSATLHGESGDFFIPL